MVTLEGETYNLKLILVFTGWNSLLRGILIKILMDP